MGDALIAGVGAGELSGFDVIMQWIEFDREVLPNLHNHEIYSAYFEQYKKIYLSLKDDMKAISRLSKLA